MLSPGVAAIAVDAAAREHVDAAFVIVSTPPLTIASTPAARDRFDSDRFLMCMYVTLALVAKSLYDAAHGGCGVRGDGA